MPVCSAGKGRKMKHKHIRWIRTLGGITLSAALVMGMLSPYMTDAGAYLRGEADVVEELLDAQPDQEVGDTTHPRGLVYNCDTCELYQTPGQELTDITLYSGQQIFLLARVQLSDGSVWYKIHTAVDDIDYTGYLPVDYILCTDTENLDTIELLDVSDVVEESENLPAAADVEEDETTTEAAAEEDKTATEAAVEKDEATMEADVAEDENTTEAEEAEEVPVSVLEEELNPDTADSFEASIAAFPESYKPYLRQLHASHPNWVFVMQTTNIDWNTFIENEMVQARNLVPRSMPDSYKGKQSWAYDPSTGEYIGLSGYNWVQASEAAVKYYADPRNFLTEEGIFQFELLTYNSTYQTEAGVENVLKNTFMSNTVIPNDEVTYARAFCMIGAAKNVSPYMLAARVRQEQGAGGTSPLISGTYPGFEGYYNYFNIKAAGNTETEIYVNGLTYAKEQGWNTRYNSLIGGAGILTASYIARGQDTLYLQKFDVDSSYDGTYWHQYMQNLLGAANEAKTAYTTYTSIGIMNNNFVFKIPVYTNMPASACAEPESAVDEAEVEAFVKRIYTELMGRNPEESGLAYWTKAIVDKKVSASTAVKYFANSDEFVRMKLSDEEYVERLYLTMMNRKSDAAGKAHWVSMLESGLSRDYVLYGFVLSKEFTNICKAYGVIKGSITLTENRDIYPGATQYVYRLYDKALGRTAETGGLNYWAGRIGKKQSTPYDVASLVIFSNEFESHNYSDEEYMKILYVTFMGREADASGLNYWKKELAGGASRKDVLKRFMGTTEFKNIVASYGI
jgi:beta-N-acetylglucosaminidase